MARDLTAGAIGPDRRGLRPVSGEEDARILPRRALSDSHAARLLAQPKRCQVSELRAESRGPENGIRPLECAVCPAHAIRLDGGEHRFRVEETTIDRRLDAPRARNAGATHDARQRPPRA